MSDKPNAPRCALCSAWHPGTETADGDCRANPPGADGWPRTRPDDWCRDGFLAEPCPPPPFAEGGAGSLYVLFDFRYVERYPDSAARWHAAAMAQGGPPEVQALLHDPLRAEVLIGPLTSERCGELVQWSLDLPGADNGEDEDLKWHSVMCEVWVRRALPDERAVVRSRRIQSGLAAWPPVTAARS